LLFPKKFLGIDIGTSFIKIAEVSRVGNRKKLENYGTFLATALYDKPFRTFEKSSLLLSSNDIARAIQAVLMEAKIKTRQAVFSIPDFSTFFTSFELPSMSQDELSSAVEYAARSHVPMPLSEVTLDWQITGQRTGADQKTKTRVLLVAVPKEVINQYKHIAQLAGLELFALEAEVFGLIRALVAKESRETLAIIDIGAQSTTCSIVEKGKLRLSHSFDMSGNELTEIVAKALSVEYKKAEEIKKKYGLTVSGQEVAGGKGVREILMPLIDVVLREASEIINNYKQGSQKDIQKVILAGGTVQLPGLKEYFAKSLQKETEIAFPFQNVFYPPILENNLREMGPAYAIAIGMALRGVEY